MAKRFTSLLTACLICTLGHGAKEVCYGELGCFSLQEPWVSLERPLPPPQSPEDVSTTFILYTRKTISDACTIVPRIKLDLKPCLEYDPQKTTVFIVHGYRSSADEKWLHDMKDAYLTLEDVNVFLVNWKNGSLKGLYDQAAANARIVGAEMARLGNYLKKNLGASPHRFHLIGHSLGAHVAAYMAKNISGIARLTGLEPAKPFFEGEDKEVRLDKDDAIFVEVLHTDAGPLIPLLGMGFFPPIGHVDFYVNGGLEQPGCGPKPDVRQEENSILATIEAVFEAIPCPHFRAHVYYTEAIANQNCTFWGHRRTPLLSAASTLIESGLTKELVNDVPCDIHTCIPLGLRATQFPARGSFEVATLNTSPYCLKEDISDSVMEQALKTFRQ